MTDKEVENLVKTCEDLINSAWYNPKSFSHSVSQSVWSAFCRQVKYSKRGLKVD